VNEAYIGLRIKNRTILDFAYRKRVGETGRGKYRDFYRWECKCGAQFIDVFGNIKGRAHGACKSCSELGGSGARKDYIGAVLNEREILELVSWNEDSCHSIFRVRCAEKHVAEVTLDDLMKHGCSVCWQDELEGDADARVGTRCNGRKILAYLGRREDDGGRTRAFYRYQCRCGAVYEDTWSNIKFRPTTYCRKCYPR